jgi:adenine-specific DNA-methyltransferase
MSSNKQKLELTWIGKEKQPQLEPRILIEDPQKSYGDKNTENMLIHGDNLLALKALEQDYSGKIKCVFIDPPYNTGSAFEHYDDGIEHSLWLSLMRDRLVIIKSLLSKNGSLWMTIDDNEAHYLKVLCDEVFGRDNFVANCFWQKVYSERMDSTGFSVSHDHVIIYRKSSLFQVNQIIKEQNVGQFNFFDDKLKKYYRRRSLRKEGSESLRQDRPSMWYPVSAPDGSEILPIKPDGTEGRWRWKKENVIENQLSLEFVKKDARWEIYVKQFIEENATRPPGTLWLQEDVGHNHEAKLEVKSFNLDSIFDTPKPERLIKHVIQLATNENDIVLDSFLGSGTTAAVAHKMGRRWIGIELGEHCNTHCLPRLKKVCDGTDQGGISESVGWKGGGGFRYYYLAPSLLKKDKHGNWVIDEHYNPDMLAAAMSKHEGFKYSPDEECYWKQGHSTEKDFIFTTTMFVTVQLLDKIHDELKEDESLLVCCKSFAKECENRYANITVRKIPTILLGRCEFGKDDYSLNIVNVPGEHEDEEFIPSGPNENDVAKSTSEKKEKKTKSSKDKIQTDIFESAN